MAFPSGIPPRRPCKTRRSPRWDSTAYLAFEVPPAKLREAIAGAQAMRFVVLQPHRAPQSSLAAELVDAMDDSAKVWGAGQYHPV
jgi:shikimate 5-dehydrogenase